MNCNKQHGFAPCAMSYLTVNIIRVYAKRALAKSSVRRDNLLIKGARAPTDGAFLYLSILWWIALGSLRAGRLPLSGIGTLLQSATISVTTFGGGLSNLIKGNHHEK